MSEEEQLSGWIYLSFVDDDKDKDKFLGACIVKAKDIIEGVHVAHLLQINPGGEVAAFPIPHKHLPEERWLGKFLTKEDVCTIWPGSKSVREYKSEEGQHVAR